jgi:uncharacterized membrane protein
MIVCVVFVSVLIVSVVVIVLSVFVTINHFASSSIVLASEKALRKTFLSAAPLFPEASLQLKRTSFLFRRSAFSP